MVTSAEARRIERRLIDLGRPARAAALQRFFKTGRGEYGEGDRFLGLTMPEVRRLATEYTETSLEHVDALLDSPFHEVRMLAVVLLAAKYPRADRAARTAIYRLYLGRSERINNWDLVDVSAPDVVGAHLMTRSRRVLRRLARSKSLWERRIAVVSTLAFIRREQFDDTLELAVLLLGDRQDLMHKAVGWMLREVGKRDDATLRRFLDGHAGRMPRTALRYAIERLAPGTRRRYLAATRA